MRLSLLLSVLTLPPSQGFSGETDFYFHQFLSNFLKYSFSNFSLSYPYNIFTVYFPSNSPLLKSFSSIISNLLTSALILPSNFSIASLVFSRSSFLFHVLCSTINPFYHTRYFSISYTFLLFNIFSTSHSLISFTLIGFTSSFFCLFTCSLYCTI